MPDIPAVAQNALTLWNNYRDAQNNLVVYLERYPELIDKDVRIGLEKGKLLSRRTRAKEELIDFYRKLFGNAGVESVNRYLDSVHDHTLALKYAGRSSQEVAQEQERVDAANAALDMHLGYRVTGGEIIALADIKPRTPTVIKPDEV